MTLKDGRGFIALEEWGARSRGRIVGYYDGSGTERWARNLNELFEAGIRAKFVDSMNVLFWKRAWWVSLNEMFVVVVSTGPHVRVVSLEEGDVLPFTESVLLDRMSARDASGVALLIEAADLQKLPWVASVSRKEVDRKGALDGAAVRSYAALAHVGKLKEGDRATFRLLLKTTKDSGVMNEGLRVAAIVDPEGAVDVVAEAVLRGDPSLLDGVVDAARSLPDGVIPRLKKIIEDPAAVVAARMLALRVLGTLATSRRALLATLEAATQDPVLEVARAAVNALMLSNDQEAAAALTRVLIRGGPGEEEALTYLLAKPDQRSMPGLIAALRRHSRAAEVQRRILDGLTKITGEDLGTDPASWEAWLRSKDK